MRIKLEEISSPNNKCILVTSKLKKINKCKNNNCGENLQQIELVCRNKKKKEFIEYIKQCPKCGVFYITRPSYQNKRYRTHFSEMSNNHYESDEIQKKPEKSYQGSGISGSGTLLAKQYSGTDLSSLDLQQDILKKYNASVQQKMTEETVKKNTTRKINHRTLNSKDSLPDNKESVRASSEMKTKVSPPLRKVGLDFKDFVIKGNVFSCRNNGHTIENIEAKLDLINSLGEKIRHTCSAGYCPNCNVYFILESTFKNLSFLGTFACRLIDESDYFSGNSLSTGYGTMAKESVLMQYGYNVSQNKNLSPIRRAAILALLIDENIISKAEIISYLEFFINSRSGIKSYENAVEKWSDDIIFVRNYRKGAYKQFGVASLKK